MTTLGKPSVGRSIVLLLAVFSIAGVSRSVPLIDAVKESDTESVRALLQQPEIDIDAPEADGMTALHWAAHLDDADTAALLVRAGANVNATSQFGVTPLRLASTNGSGAMLELLLRTGADPNAAIGEGETALMTAARTGSVDAVKLLLAHGADVNATLLRGQTALMWAAAEDHPAVIRALIEAGADVSARTDAEVPQAFRRTPIGGFTAFLFAVRAGHIEAARALIEGGADISDQLADGMGAVVLATTNAHYEVALFLVDQSLDPDQGLDPDEAGYTALHALTWVRRPPYGNSAPGPVTTGNVDGVTFVREMVERGADVNARMTGEPRTRFRKSFNWIGATPLIMAAKVADTPMVRVLLELGADPTITTDENTTLLMVTAGVGIASPGEDGGTEEEALECTQLVLGLGGDINALDDNGETALHGAAYRLAPSVVQLLINNGAETFTVQNQAGWTPLHIATGVLRQGTYKESPQAAALLRQAMTERGLSTTLEEPVTVSGEALRR